MTRLAPSRASLAGAIAVAVLALTATGCGSATRSASTQQQASAPARSTASARGLTIAEVYRRDGPGVVDITVTTPASASLFGGPEQTQAEGAGVVYDTNGDILTDEHVVAGASSVTVTFDDGHKVGAKVVGTDPSTDVAVIHVARSASELHPIAFADSSGAQVGDPVVVIGSPFGLPGTVTSGIVSAVGRSITAPNNFTITGAIQTDAPINPGNSGGPVLDSGGRVLGLADQIETDNTSPTGLGSSSGVGFATASNLVARIAGKIIAGKPVRHPYVGVTLNGDSAGGAQITSIETTSPASRAGLHQGDLITAIDGQAIASTQRFIETIDGYHPGQTITLTIRRSAGTLKIKLTLGTRPQIPSSPGG